MTNAPTIERKTRRAHRAKSGLGQYVTDQELIEWLGVPADLGRQALSSLDGNPRTHFPKKQAFWGNRRYLPAVQAWLDANNGLKIDASQRRAS